MSYLPSHRREVAAIVIGASAGGIDALLRLLPALPATLSAPVYIVVHLPAEGTSVLADIFAPKCALPVREAEDNEPVMPGTVYFAPADYHLLVESGPRLALSVDAPVQYSRPAIDLLFESAADLYGATLLSLLLSGANADGTDGVASVHRAGGMTVLQDPLDAQAPYMTQNAFDRVKVDAVLGLAEIAGLLASLTESAS